MMMIMMIITIIQMLNPVWEWRLSRMCSHRTILLFFLTLSEVNWNRNRSHGSAFLIIPLSTLRVHAARIFRRSVRCVVVSENAWNKHAAGAVTSASSSLEDGEDFRNISTSSSCDHKLSSWSSQVLPQLEAFPSLAAAPWRWREDEHSGHFTYVVLNRSKD